MNQSINTRRLRMSFMTLGASAAAMIIAYAATTILEARRLREQTPRLAVDSMVKALRAYHGQTGRFPDDFRELEERGWKHKNAPQFRAHHPGMYLAHYLYIYAPVEP